MHIGWIDGKNDAHNGAENVISKQVSWGETRKLPES
jgi:hypothetical protein